MHVPFTGGLQLGSCGRSIDSFRATCNLTVCFLSAGLLMLSGRSDATEDSVGTPAYLESRLTGGRDLHAGTIGTIDIMRDTALVMGTWTY